ncbi:hypothetical protein H7673_10830, partial [Streptococcus dysgalactiae subsp. equisimilis]|nr:hypothetical protein [Streptococcus dysgalactiae subsp. equisimilis]
MGDFNAPHVDWDQGHYGAQADAFTRSLLDLLLEGHLFQHVRSPTRLQGTQTFTLDLVLSPSQRDIAKVDVLPPLGSSDHALLAIHWNRSNHKSQPTGRKLNVWRIPFESMKLDAALIDWETADEISVDELWCLIRDRLTALTRNYVPVLSTFHQGPPWFDQELRALLRRRNRAWQHFRKTGSGYERYKQMRNECTQQKRTKRLSFENRLVADAKTAPKRLYAYLRRRTRDTTGVPAIATPSSMAETAEEKSYRLAHLYRRGYTT